jgi:hypothetical protein
MVASELLLQYKSIAIIGHDRAPRKERGAAIKKAICRYPKNALEAE